MSFDGPDTQGNMTLTISGNYYNGSFGSKNNTIDVYYRYKTGSGSYGDDIAVTNITLSGNTYSASISFTGLSYTETYTFQAGMSDELMLVETKERAVKTTPVFDWGKSDFRVNVPVNITDDINMTTNGSYINMTDITGEEYQAIGGKTNFWLGGTGSGARHHVGATYISTGYNTDTSTGNSTIKIAVPNDSNDGSTIYQLYHSGNHGNKVLWSGSSWMNKSDTITLSEAVSAQAHGLILVFSGCSSSNGSAYDYNYASFYVAKEYVRLHNGGGCCFALYGNPFSPIGMKYLYISDTEIKGNANNVAGATANGITFNSKNFSLRYVLGA